MIRIHTTTSPQEAEFLRAELGARGIDSALENEGAAFYAIGFPTPAIPLVVSVPAPQAEEAIRIVAEVLSKSRTEGDPAAVTPAGPCSSCGKVLEVPEGEDPPSECPWCARSAAPVPSRAGGSPVRAGPSLFRSFFLVALAAVAIFGLYEAWPDAEPAREPAADALFRMLHERASSIAEPEDLKVDAEALCDSLERVLGPPAEVLGREVDACSGSEELIKLLLRKWIELDPDWALELGLAEPSALTVHAPITYRSIAYLEAQALRRLGALGRGDPGLDEILLQRRLESTLVWNSLSGFDRVDPSAAFRGIQATYALLEPEGVIPPARLALLAARLEGVPGVVLEISRHLRDPPRLWIELALDELELTRELLQEYLQAGSGSGGAEERLQAAVRGADAALLGYREVLQRELKKPERPIPQDARWVRYSLRSQEFHAASLREAMSVLLEEAYGCARIRDSLVPPEGIWRPPAEMSFDSYLEECRQAIGWARNFTQERGIADIPADEPIRVASAPPHFKLFAQAAYWPVSFAPSLRARFLVVRPEGAVAISPHEIRLTALHETYPGHHLHELWSRQGASAIQRLYPSSWLLEGWATHVERMALGEPTGTTWQDRYDWHSRQSWLAWLCVLESCVAAGAVTEQEAVEFLRVCLHYDPKQARQAVGIMSRSPLASLGYVLGEREIRQMKTDLEERLGERYDPREFHERLLRFGRTPLALVRRELARTWK